MLCYIAKISLLMFLARYWADRTRGWQCVLERGGGGGGPPGAGFSPLLDSGIPCGLPV